MQGPPEGGEDFGTVVRELLGGRTYREVAKGCQIHYTTLYNWAQGFKPRSPEQIGRLADYLKLGVAERARLLTAAGFGYLFTNGAERLVEGLMALQERYPERSIPVPRMRGGARSLSVAEAESILADMEDKLKRGVL